MGWPAIAEEHCREAPQPCRGLVFNIMRFALHDGPGIRTTVFLKGCPLNCWWCHNPEGQWSQPQLIFRANRCKSSKACLEICPQGAIHWDDETVVDWDRCDHCGKCVDVCYAGALEMVGRNVTVAQVMDEVDRDIPFYDQSGGGVTITGGEPLFQAEFLEGILNECKERQINTAVDTSGQTSWENIRRILPFVDLFLYDVKLMDETRHIRYTSVSNKKILNNLLNLSNTGAHIIVRIPLVPGINDDTENLEMCASMLAELPYLEGVEIMPYHEIGVAKYQALGMKYKLNNISTPSDEKVSKVEELFTTYKLPVIKKPSRAI